MKTEPEKPFRNVYPWLSGAVVLEAVRKGQRSQSVWMGYFGLSGLFNWRRQVFFVPHGFREKSRWFQKPMETEQWKMALGAFSYSLLQPHMQLSCPTNSAARLLNGTLK